MPDRMTVEILDKYDSCWGLPITTSTWVKTRNKIFELLGNHVAPNLDASVKRQLVLELMAESMTEVRLEK